MENSEALRRAKSFPLWLTDKYIYAMLFVFPLFTGFWGYSEITASKAAFFYGLSGLWLLCLLAWRIFFPKEKSAQHPSIPEICLLGFLLLCCVSALASPFGTAVLLGAGRFDGLVNIIICCCVFFAVSRFGKMKIGYVYALGLSAFICCLVAIFQLLGFDPLWLYPGDLCYYDGGIKYSSQFLGTIGNADLFSAFLCLALPLLAVVYITSDRRAYILLPAIALTAFCLFVCGVSGGVLAILVLALVAAPFLLKTGERLRRALEICGLFCLALFVALSFEGLYENGIVTIGFNFSQEFALLPILALVFLILRIALKNREFKAKSLSRFFVLLSVSVLALGLCVAYFWRGSEGTIFELSRLLHGEVLDSFGSSRILIWRKTMELVPEHLLLGGGPGSLPLRLDLEFSRFVAETGETLSTFVDNAHNEYLGILVNTGLLSLLAYLAALGTSLWSSAKSFGKQPLLPALCCALFCYWVQGFFNLGLLLVSPLMFILWGLLCGKIRKP
ncbi:MAG: O-antigen ligase family protein [Oscillospiraceae bacterium]